MPFWWSCSLHNTVLFQHPNVQMAGAGSGASTALWYNTAQMNKSYKETLQSSVSPQGVRDCWSCLELVQFFGTEAPSVRPLRLYRCSTRATLSLTHTHTHTHRLSAGLPAENPINNNAVLANYCRIRECRCNNFNCRHLSLLVQHNYLLIRNSVIKRKPN